VKKLAFYLFLGVSLVCLSGCVNRSSFPTVPAPKEDKNAPIKDKDYTGNNLQKATQAFKNNDCEASVRYLEIACDEEVSMQACYQLGNMYDKAKCAEKSDIKARPYYQKACDGGNLNACMNLASFYKDGRGGAKNEEMAVELNKKACSGNIAKACNNVGYFYHNGKGVDLDRTEARKYFKKACELDPDGKCYYKKREGEGAVKA